MKSILITSSILILLTAALRPLLRGRLDPRVQYALWLAAALRLLLPVELAPSAYSAMSLVNRAEEKTHLAQSIGQASVPVPAMSYEDAFDMALQEYQERQTVTTSFTDLDQVELRAREIQAQRPTLAQLAEQYARPVWLGGGLVMAVWFLLVNVRLRRKLRAALPVEADCPLPVYVTPELPSPCLCGVLRPAVYVTPAALADPDRLRHVLAHELTHHRHGDHWWAWVRCLCLCLYWFNPLVWWAAALSRQDCELACDEGAIRRLGEEQRIPYGRTLVAMIAVGRTPLLQTSTTMTGSKRRVRERIRLIARRPRTMAAAALAAAVLVTCAVGCTFTGAPEDSPQPEASAQPAPLAVSQPSADTLQERLLDLPEELSAGVKASASETKSGLNNIALASYWWDVPAEWESERDSWLLSVHQWERSLLDSTGWAADSDDHMEEIIAQDEAYYYTIERFPDARLKVSDETAFFAVYQAVRDYALEQVLATEGVEAMAAGPDVPVAVSAVVSQLMAAPSVNLTPTRYSGFSGSSSYHYSTVPSEDACGVRLTGILSAFTWEEFDWGTTEDPRFPAWPEEESAGLRIELPDYSVQLNVCDGSDLVRVHDEVLGTNWYHARYAGESDGPTIYEYLLPWYDEMTSSLLRPPILYPMSYSLVTSWEDVPEDPEQWYLVGQVPGERIWMFTRNHGAETQFQLGDRLTQAFPYRACCYGEGYAPDGRPPQLRQLLIGRSGGYGAVAAVTHLFQGGTDQQYQLTVYDMDANPIAAYVHDWEPLMEDFNAKRTVALDESSRTATISYEGQSVEITFHEGDAVWDSILKYGFDPSAYEYSMSYSINYIDGLVDLIMPIWEPPVYSACWTIRFTGSGFETVGFRFIESSF